QDVRRVCCRIDLWRAALQGWIRSRERAAIYLCVGEDLRIQQIDQAGLSVGTNLRHLPLHDLTVAAKEGEGPADWEPEGVDTASRVEVAPDGVVVDPKTRLGEVARVVRYWRSHLHHRRGTRRRGGGDCRGCRW